METEKILNLNSLNVTAYHLNMSISNISILFKRYNGISIKHYTENLDHRIRPLLAKISLGIFLLA